MKFTYTTKADKFLNAQGWSASHSGNDCTAYVPIHQDGKVIALVVATGDYNKLDEMVEARCAALTGTTWTPASHPPDADITVMMALTDGEVWQGYFDGAVWIEVSGLPLAAGRVQYWMHTPAHPEDRA